MFDISSHVDIAYGLVWFSLICLLLFSDLLRLVPIGQCHGARAEGGVFISLLPPQFCCSLIAGIARAFGSSKSGS
eukprot:6492774-Amphidinium_carterae.2